MHGRSLFTTLGCLWKVKATYPGLPGPNSWCRAPCIGFLATASLVNLRPRFKSVSRSQREDINYWTEEELAILSQGRAEGLKYVELARRLPGRTVQACKNRARNFTRIRKKYWTREEDEILTQSYAEGLRREEISKVLLPGRTIMACKDRGRYLKLEYLASQTKPWTTEEDEILAQSFTKGLRREEIAEVLLPGRTVGACKYRGAYLKLEYLAAQNKPWTTEEDEILAQSYGEGLRCEEIAEVLLPGRTVIACQVRGRYLKLEYLAAQNKPWTTEEDEILAQSYGEGLRCEEIAEVLLPGRTIMACKFRRSHLKLEYLA